MKSKCHGVHSSFPGFLHHLFRSSLNLCLHTVFLSGPGNRLRSHLGCRFGCRHLHGFGDILFLLVGRLVFIHSTLGQLPRRHLTSRFFLFPFCLLPGLFLLSQHLGHSLLPPVPDLGPVKGVLNLGFLHAHHLHKIVIDQVVEVRGLMGIKVVALLLVGSAKICVHLVFTEIGRLVLATVCSSKILAGPDICPSGNGYPARPSDSAVSQALLDHIGR